MNASLKTYSTPDKARRALSLLSRNAAAKKQDSRYSLCIVDGKLIGGRDVDASSLSGPMVGHWVDGYIVFFKANLLPR